MQVIEPTFKTYKELNNLNLTISHYVDSVSVQLNSKETGWMVYHKSYNNYDSTAISEIKEFIRIFDDELESKSVSGSTKLYFELINYNW